MGHKLRFRQIHLDFHTSERIAGIGSRFDADAFADTLARAHVDSVTCFGRCHHGWLYYDTDQFAERRHPNLTSNLLKEQIEDKAGIQLSGSDVIVQWIVRWAALLVSRYLVGKDGKTGIERRHGRRCNIPSAPFAEVVWYRQIRKTKHQEHKLETEMRLGIWLGHARNANEVLIGTPHGVVRAYDVRRREEGAQWNGQLGQDHLPEL